MRKTLLILMFALLAIGSVFGLTAGDIAILGVNTDATKSMAFVALADIPANTTISFTDNAWNATTETWRTGEGIITWTHDAIVTQGTVVTITLGATYAASIGTVTTNSNFNLSASGDQILAYEGTTAPASNADATWLYGFSIENWLYANNTNTSDIPAALSGASVGLTTSTTEVDNGYFANGSTAQTAVTVTGSKAVLLALFGDSSKYYTNDVGPLTFPAYTITVSGAVTPTIIVSGTLDPFSTIPGIPSAVESYNLSGANLTNVIQITLPAGFQCSPTMTGPWYTGTTVAPGYNAPIYIRLLSPTAGTFSGNITHTSTGAAQVDLPVSGTVTEPTPTISVFSEMTGFSTLVGTPSDAQQYTIQGQALTNSIVVTAPAGFEISQNGSVYTPSITLANNYFGNVYVRLNGTTVGPYFGNITHTSSPAPQVDLAVSGTVNPPAGPTTFFEENFVYAVGDTLINHGWNVTGTNATPVVTVSNGNLVYTGYYAYTGNSVSLASGQDVNHTFTPQIDGSIYTSFLINITSAQTGDYFLHLGQAAMSTSYYGRVSLRRDGTTDNAFIGLVFSSGTGAVTQYTTTSYPYGSTILLVLKYQIVDGTMNDVVSLFVNPAISATEPIATLTHSNGYNTTTTDPSTIGSIGLRQGGAASAAVVKVDGIRVTNDWPLLWAGTPPPTPVISVTGELAPFTCYINNPSEENQSYSVGGVDLMGGITATAPNGFELSLNGTDGWNSTVFASGPYPQTIYVRMLATALGEYTGHIVHTSPNAANVNLAISGECFPPDVTWNIVNNMVPFSTQAGTPSAAQPYSLQALNATGDITVTTAAPFQLATTTTGPWQQLLTYPSSYNGLVYVRLNSAGAGTFNGAITHNTAGVGDSLIAVSGTASPAPGMAADLFFSEYIEGASNNKAIEIFNGTGGPVDLGNYRIYQYSNGGSSPQNTLTFAVGTMLNHNDVYVIANESANATILGLADVTSTVTFYNGDDALALVKMVGEDTLFVDIFGMIGQDPGTEWTADGGYSTLNKTLVRKPTVAQGVSVNPAGHAAGDVTAFETLGTEWDVYPIDTISYLGSHTFNPSGNPMAATPSFDPPAGTYLNPINVVITSATPGATIYYTTDGSVPDNTSNQYMGAVPISATTTLKAIAYAPGFDPSSVAIGIYSFPTNVIDIEALRAMPAGATVYRLTGEAVLTFQQANRHQKYIQDATAAILIDDNAGIITSTYNLYDGITGIAGTLATYSGLLQFVPVADPGPATSTNNVVVPAVRTLATITSDDQAKLLKIMNVTLDATNVNFAATAENINATDASGTGVMRTFPATDYSNTAIPTAPVDIVCLGGQYQTTMQFSPRFLADITPAAGTLEAPIVAISEAAGTITLSWDAIAGATSYRVEGSNDPYGTYSTLATVTTGTTWSGAATAMKFFRVIALN